MNRNRDNLEAVIENANNIFDEIIKKYNGIKAYLVFSSPYGQCEMTSIMQTILEEFPEMVHDSIYKERASKLIQDIRDFRQALKRVFDAEFKDEMKAKMDDAVKKLEPISENLELKKDTFVEIRFKALDYNIIDELRKDPLISLKHTPQTRASIRIVLGTLDELYQHQDEV